MAAHAEAEETAVETGVAHFPAFGQPGQSGHRGAAHFHRPPAAAERPLAPHLLHGDRAGRQLRRCHHGNRRHDEPEAVDGPSGVAHGFLPRPGPARRGGAVRHAAAHAPQPAPAHRIYDRYAALPWRRHVAHAPAAAAALLRRHRRPVVHSHFPPHHADASVRGCAVRAGLAVDCQRAVQPFVAGKRPDGAPPPAPGLAVCQPAERAVFRGSDADVRRAVRNGAVRLAGGVDERTGNERLRHGCLQRGTGRPDGQCAYAGGHGRCAGTPRNGLGYGHGCLRCGRRLLAAAQLRHGLRRLAAGHGDDCRLPAHAHGGGHFRLVLAPHHAQGVGGIFRRLRGVACVCLDGVNMRL